MPNDVKESKTLNAIQVRIYNNIRMLDELHERWEREKKEAEIAKQSSVVKVCTIFTTKTDEPSSSSKSPTINGKIIHVINVSTSTAKNFKLPNSTNIVPDKSAQIFRSVGDNGSITFDDNKFDFDGYNIT